MPLEAFRETYIHLVPSVFGFFFFTALAVISLLRARRNPTNVLFACLCAMGALINIDTALVSFVRDKALALRIDRLIYFIFVFSIPLYVKFVHSFLGISRRRWLEIAFFSAGIVLSLSTQTEFFIVDLDDYAFGRVARAGFIYNLFYLFGAAASLYCLWVLVKALGAAGENREKNRIKYILGGMGLTTLLLLLHYLPVSGLGLLSPVGFSFVPALILAFGILKYNLLDFGAVVRKSTIYLVLTGTLAAFYVLIIYIFHSVFLMTGYTDSLAFPLLFAALIVLLFDPLRRRTERTLDRVLFKGKYDYREILKDISGKMTSLLNLDEIRRFLIESISAAMQTRNVRLFIRSGDSGDYDEGAARGELDSILKDNNPLVCFLRTTREPIDRLQASRQASDEKDEIMKTLDSLKCVLAIPLFSKRELLGFLALGEKKSGELFVKEDYELLATIANQSAIAVENAFNFREVENLNRDLEKRIEERTADLARAVEEKDRTRDRLIRSESLAAIGQLVAGTAHEMNNPLSSASSLIQTGVETLVESGRPEDSELIDDLQFCLKELKRAKGIIDSLLGLSRQNDDYTEPVDVHAAIEDALRVLHNGYKNMNVEIVKKYDPELPPVVGNFAGLGQLFMNILKNAFQAVGTTGGSERSRITIETFVVKSGQIGVSFRDNGSGIPASLIKDIFKPFFTTKEVGKGTGLGLYICHEIVKKHRGEIYVESREGEGTVFIIDLPCRREPAGAA
jgi:signal transduction histidine kinase